MQLGLKRIMICLCARRNQVASNLKMDVPSNIIAPETSAESQVNGNSALEQDT